LNLAFPKWHVSDDTILNIASAEGLLKEAKTRNEMLQNLYDKYVLGMHDMNGRSPGLSCSQNLRPSKLWNYMVPFYSVRFNFLEI
jgi:ADP-ribosylglycohydrolase